MSISSLVDANLVRQQLKEPQAPFKSPMVEAAKSVRDVESGNLAAIDKYFAQLLAAQAEKEESLKATTATALDTLVAFIPTEIITLYIALSSAFVAVQTLFPQVTEIHAYWFCVVLNPVVFLLVLIGKRKSLKQSAFPDTVGEFPWWEMIAATISFMVWALTVPSTLFEHDLAQGTVMALVAIVVSIFLTLLDPIFRQRERPPTP